MEIHIYVCVSAGFAVYTFQTSTNPLIPMYEQVSTGNGVTQVTFKFELPGPKENYSMYAVMVTPAEVIYNCDHTVSVNYLNAVA